MVYTATITNSWPGREVCHLFETTPARPLEEEGLDVAGSSEKGSRKWWKLTCAKRRWPCLKQDQQKCTVISTYMGKLQLTNLQKKSGNFGRQDAMYIIPWWNHLYLFVAIIWPCESDKNSCLGGLPQCFLLFFVNASWRYNYRKQLEDHLYQTRLKGQAQHGRKSRSFGAEIEAWLSMLQVGNTWGGGDVDLDWVCTHRRMLWKWRGDSEYTGWTISSAIILDYPWWSERNDRFIISSSSCTEFMLAVPSTSCVSLGSKRGHADQIAGIAGWLNPLNLCTKTVQTHPTYTTPRSKNTSKKSVCQHHLSSPKEMQNQNSMHPSHSQLIHSAGQKSRVKRKSPIAQVNCWQKKFYLM